MSRHTTTVTRPYQGVEESSFYGVAPASSRCGRAASRVAGLSAGGYTGWKPVPHFSTGCYGSVALGGTVRSSPTSSRILPRRRRVIRDFAV